jgi:hypothetical protein
VKTQVQAPKPSVQQWLLLLCGCDQEHILERRPQRGLCPVALRKEGTGRSGSADGRADSALSLPGSLVPWAVVFSHRVTSVGSVSIR